MKLKFILPLFAFVIFLTACDNSADQPVNKEYLGNSESKVDVQIYSDIECPACSRASNFTDVLLENYEDQIKISFHHFPLESIHPHAFGAAVAAECAGKQGAFWKYVKYVYRFQDQLDTKNLKKHAINLALDTEAFNTCVDNQETADIVKSDLQRALQMGLRGTPTFAINGEVVKSGSSYEDIFLLIDAAIKEVTE